MGSVLTAQIGLFAYIARCIESLLNGDDGKLQLAADIAASDIMKDSFVSNKTFVACVIQEIERMIDNESSRKRHKARDNRNAPA